MTSRENFSVVPPESGDEEKIPEGPWTGNYLAEGEIALQQALGEWGKAAEREEDTKEREVK